MRVYLVFFVLWVPFQTDAGITNLVINVSRLSGVAPLAVHFETVGSTSDATQRPFHDIYYAWDFGNPGAGTWPTVGLDKNAAHGPIAAHLYTVPGIYTVTLTATDPVGGVAVQTIQINVLDPDIVFSGQNTVCARTSGSSDFQGCPSGALQVTDASFDSVLANHLAPGVRVLFRRGDTFTNAATTELGMGPVSIGAFGAGVRPHVSSSIAGQQAIFDLGNFNPARSADDIRIADLDFDGNFTTSFLMRHSSNGTIKNVVLASNRALNFAHNIVWMTDSGSPQDVHQHIFIFDNEMQGYGSRPLFLGVKQSAVMGNTFTLHANYQGVNSNRFHYINRVVNSYNIHDGANPGGSAVKFAGNENYVDGATDYQYFYFAHNRVSGGGNGTMQMRLSRNAGELGLMEDFLFENNYHIREGDGYGGALISQAVNKMTIRNSIFDLSSTSGVGPAVFTDTKNGTTAQETRVFNNTCYDNNTTPDWCIRLTAGSSHHAENNLYYSPQNNNNRVVNNTTGAVDVNNLQTTTNPFVSTVFTNPSHFSLDPNSPIASSIIDIASCVPGVLFDFFFNPRPTGPACDIGAHETERAAVQLSAPGVPQTLASQ